MTDLSRAYLQGGVSIDPMPPEFKSRVNVSYAGKLATRADGQLYMMVGYGPVDKIFQQQEIRAAAYRIVRSKCFGYN